MGEPATPRRASVRNADEGDSLAAINDHLGRFLRQADELLEEWSRFGGDVRARVTAEAERVGAVVEQAVDASVDRVAARAADRVSDQVAGQLADRLAAIGAELDRVTRAARRASSAANELDGDRRHTQRWLAAGLALALFANLALVILLFRSPSSAPAPPTPGLSAACRELSSGWSDSAFSVIRAAGADACGALSPTVDAVIAAKLHTLSAPPPPPVDAGVPVDAAPDAAPAPKSPRRAR